MKKTLMLLICVAGVAGGQTSDCAKLVAERLGQKLASVEDALNTLYDSAGLPHVRTNGMTVCTSAFCRVCNRQTEEPAKTNCVAAIPATRQAWREETNEIPSEEYIRSIAESGRICEVLGHKWDNDWLRISQPFYAPNDTAYRRCGICQKSQTKREVWE